jgi:hypothetical protein
MRVLIASLILVLSMSSLCALAQGKAESEAERVLLRYFDALSQGDTLTLRSLMDGRLLETRSRLLDNPAWPAFLVETFAGATFSIDRIETLSEAEIAIEATIVFGEDDTIPRRFLLRGESAPADARETFRIHDESGPGSR